MYKIKTEDVYEDLYKDIEFFNFSNYPKVSKHCNNSKNLVVGKMKDERSGLPIKSFVGLKSKMHAFIAEDDHESKRAKGINKNIVGNGK